MSIDRKFALGTSSLYDKYFCEVIVLSLASSSLARIALLFSLKFLDTNSIRVSEVVVVWHRDTNMYFGRVTPARRVESGFEVTVGCEGSWAGVLAGLKERICDFCDRLLLVRLAEEGDCCVVGSTKTSIELLRQSSKVSSMSFAVFCFFACKEDSLSVRFLFVGVGTGFAVCSLLRLVLIFLTSSSINSISMECSASCSFSLFSSLSFSSHLAVMKTCTSSNFFIREVKLSCSHSPQWNLKRPPKFMKKSDTSLFMLRAAHDAWKDLPQCPLQVKAKSDGE